MIHNLHNMASASSIFFGPTSILTVNLESWQPEISSNLITYESQATNDNTFIASVLTSIDTRVNCWLSECTTKENRCNVDDDLIEFSDLQRSIRIRQFHFALPPSIRSHISSSTCRKSDTITGNQGNGRGDSKRSPVQNTKKNNRWKLRDGESYADLFSEKHIDKRPKLDGVKICPRWHIKGVCFKECNLSATHKVITNDSACNAMDAYCRLCRGE